VIDAGAIASVIINDEPGMLNGSFGGRMDAIAVGVSGEDGLRLLNAIQSGSASASLNLVETDQPSQNVVATLAGSSGRTIVLGAHYDSVVDSPGVNDNASGVAIVLTLAEWFAQHERRDTIQVILFGAEEVELQGSRHFVASLSAGQLGSIEFMVNFDAVATGALQTGGSPDLVSDAIHVADVAGFPLAAEGVPPGAASDHTPFELAGTPALVIFGSDYSKIHSTDDTQQWINPALLGQASAIGIQMALVD
jgi:aminopeptidase YwaD